MLKLKHTAATALLVNIKNIWLLLLWLGLINTGYASNQAITPSLYNSANNPTLIKQRTLFQDAINADKKHQYSRFNRLTARLLNYPLYPYLEYRKISRRIGKLSSQQISAFLQKNNNTLIADRFRLKLIKHAARKSDWWGLIDIYQANFGIAAQCYYLNALIQTKQASIAYPKIKRLWLSPRSRAKACDAPFKLWAAAGNKTPELVWQRFELAMSINNRGLARFLLRSMPKKDAIAARLWLNVNRHPSLVTSEKILNLQHPAQLAILIHGLKRLASKDIDKAIKAFYQLKNFPFSQPQRNQIQRDISLRLARNHMPEAAIWLARIKDDKSDPYLMQWKVRTGIRQGDWSSVLTGINNLSMNDQADYRWQYWWAYANEQLGNSIDAQGMYQYLATKRSYYGFLAADHLNLQYNFENIPVTSSAEEIDQVRQQPEAIRAREFYIMGEILPARREWHRLIKRLDNPLRLAASKLAQLWGWHDQAIITMGKTRYRDDIELRFPLQYDYKIHNWSHQHNIEPAWTYAIIRRESAFMYDARSSVGALGLMQIMPNTARQVARQLKVRYRSRHSLLASNLNIQLGTGYLERMFDKLYNQQVLATTAYNAGPRRVKKWLPEKHSMGAIRWIETIPFTETREYVSNVLAYMAIYEHRLDKKVTRLSQRMPRIPAKNPPIISQNQTMPTSPRISKIAKKDPS